MQLITKHSEHLIVLLVLFTIIPASWMMGGYYYLAPHWMGVGGILAFLFAAFVLFKQESFTRGNPAYHVVWFFWLGLIVYLIVSLLNPSYERVSFPEGMTYVIGSPVNWLPSVVSKGYSGPLVFQFIGSLLLAWSMLAILKNRSIVRVLFMGLVVNALVLSLVGAWFKITGAANIFNVFQAVNSKFYASFTYHNHWVAFAGFHMMVGTGLACYYAFHPGRKRGQSRDSNKITFLWISVFFLLLSLLLVESRTGVLVVIFYIGVLFLYFLRRCLVLRQPGSKLVSVLSLIGLLMLSAISYQIVYPQLSSTGDRMETAWYQFWDDASDVDQFRFEAGPKITSELIREKTMFGWGRGSYPLAMSLYSADFLENAYAQHAHNDWLQLFAELGFVGVFLYMFPMVHMSIHFKPKNNLTRFCRLGIGLLMLMALIDGPFSNPVVLSSVLIVFFADLCMGRERADSILEN